MALHAKWPRLASWRPDIAVVAECAAPEILAERLGARPWRDAVWVGDPAKRNKGLGVFAFGRYRAAMDPAHRQDLQWIAPVRITGSARFNLLAVWAQNASAGIRKRSQAGPLREALVCHRRFLNEGPAVVAGDFNNNPFWDRPGWPMNHQETVADFERLGMESIYHAATGEAPGEETTPTHYWRDRRRDGPVYHIDYIFAPKAWRRRTRRAEIGSFEEWCGRAETARANGAPGLSDHAPVLWEVVAPRPKAQARLDFPRPLGEPSVYAPGKEETP